MGDILTSIVRPLLSNVRPIALLIVIGLHTTLLFIHFGSETQNIPVFRLEKNPHTINRLRQRVAPQFQPQKYSHKPLKKVLHIQSGGQYLPQCNIFCCMSYLIMEAWLSSFPMIPILWVYSFNGMNDSFMNGVGSLL